MKTKKMLWIGLFLLSASFILPAKTVTLPEIKHATDINVDDQQLYVSEGTAVSIYSLNDFKLLKKIGEKGKASRQFKGYARVIPCKDNLMIDSFGKVSYFSKNGEFQKEIKTVKDDMFYGLMRPLKNGYVGIDRFEKDGFVYAAAKIYDSKLVQQKELLKTKIAYQKTGPILYFRGGISPETYDNKIFITRRLDFTIDVLDHTGKKLHTIKREYKKRKISKAQQERMLENFKLQFKNGFEKIKARIDIPDVFPALMNIIVTDGRIYAITWKQVKDDYELFVYDVKGKFLKKSHIPLVTKNVVMTQPYAIKNNKFYTIGKDENNKWTLSVTEIK